MLQVPQSNLVTRGHTSFRFASVKAHHFSICLLHSPSTMTYDLSYNFNCSFSGTPLTSYLQSLYIVAGVVTAVSCLLGIPANITIIVQLSRHLRGSSMTQRLFFNLAVSDFLCLICLPFGVFIFFRGICHTNGVYQFLLYSFIFCITTDLNILVLISIQRYYQVCNYQLHRGFISCTREVTLFFRHGADIVANNSKRVTLNLKWRNTWLSQVMPHVHL